VLYPTNLDKSSLSSALVRVTGELRYTAEGAYEFLLEQLYDRRYEEDEPMNWDQVEGKWKQYTGKVKEKWGKLTDDDITTIKGKRDQLIGKVQERYGIAKDQAEKQVDEFTHSLSDLRDTKKVHGAGH
jgi:uncharacterized protein YjbJ (UPF0337 family)